MRITNNMMIANMVNNLQTNIRRLDKTQLQYSTGKRIHKPSDDPVAITRSLKIKADINELRQYKKNVEDATSWLENTEEAVVNSHEALKRLRDLMVQGANGVLSDEDMVKVQNEVTQIKNQIISDANTSYSGDYIFSGKKTNEKLLNPDGSYNIEIMEFLDPNIIDHRINYEVGVGEYIPINTIGTSLFEAAKLAMNVQLPVEDGEITKLEFLGAEISLTGVDSPISQYDLEINIGDDIEPLNESIGVITKEDEDGNEIIDQVATRASIYETIQEALAEVQGDPEKAEAWNKILIEKEIPVDINNIEFATYTNKIEGGEKIVGLVAQPQKAGLIQLIERIEKDLIEGNNEGVSDLLGSIDKFLDNLLVARGDIGAKVNRTELILDRIEDDIINLRGLQSKLEDADLAETAIQLMNEENVYRSSLAVGARIIQPTLLDFLR